MKPFVLKQQLPEEPEGKGSAEDNPSSWQYAVPLTLDACRCPHLQAWLPHELNLECVRNSGTDTWRMSNPVHALHLASHTNSDGTTVTVSENDLQAMYGDEQRRTAALQMGGFTDSFYPVVAPPGGKAYSRRKTQEKAPPKVFANTSMLVKSTPLSSASSNAMNQKLSESAPMSVSTIAEPVDTSKETETSIAAPTSNDGTTVAPASVISNPMSASEQSLTSTAFQKVTTEDKSSNAVSSEEQGSSLTDNKVDENGKNDESEATQVGGEAAQEPSLSSSDMKKHQESIVAQQDDVTEKGETDKEKSMFLREMTDKEEDAAAPQHEAPKADETTPEPPKVGSDMKDGEEKMVGGESENVRSVETNPGPTESGSDAKKGNETIVAQQGEVTQDSHSQNEMKDDQTDAEDDTKYVDSQRNVFSMPELTLQGPSDISDSKETQASITGIEKSQEANESVIEMRKSTRESSPDKTMSDNEIKRAGVASENSSPKDMSTAISSSATEARTVPRENSPERMPSQTMPSSPKPTAVAKSGEIAPEKFTSRGMETEPRSVNQGIEPFTSVRSPSDFLLPFSRYQQLRHVEDRILKQRRVLASKRKLRLDQVNKKKPSSTSTAKKRRSSGTSKSGESGQGYNRPSALAGLSFDFGGNGQGVIVELDVKDQALWEQGAMRARSKVEEWMELVRLNRRAFWDSKFIDRKQKRKVGEFGTNFGGLSSHFSLEQRCELSHSKPAWGFNPASPSEGCVFATGDDLLQCLECSFIGCAPCSTSPNSQQHIVQHLLSTGHTFAISCGPRAELFCFRCGDFVYHEVFDREKERVDISKQLPWMGWKEHAVQRSFDPMQFVTTPDHGVVWRGLIATYPILVPEEYLLSARLSRKRLLMFQGEVEGWSLTWGPRAVDFAAHQQVRHQKGSKWRIGCPVGLYNLGNTCFMSAVLQCLVHCAPLQRHFLCEVGHHHESCQVLRRSEGRIGSEANGEGAGPENKTTSTGSDICLACEMDILFLRYFGNSVGKDAVGAVREPLVVSTRNGAYDTPKPVRSDLRGEPLVTSDLLTAAWRSGGMDHLAGYEQRDAHEFLQGFLDIVGKHASQHRKRLRMTLNLADNLKPIKRQEHHAKMDDDDIVRSLFEGILRSVLICEECGCKRSLSEPFLNISLPLAKEMERNAIGTRLAANRLKICVQQCLKHFTAPESLGDPVQCPSCNRKTPTKKQHTFAKLPRVLCLHLKRFDAANNKKIDDFVSFPAYGLDMGQHLPHWCEVMQGARTEDKEGSEETTSSPQILYDLFGTVNHNGNLNQGHYVSNVKVGGQWYHCNDAFVCKAGSGDGEQDVLKSDGAYVLFYIRR